MVAGRPSLRTPDGWRELVPGDVVAFPVGAGGAHQVSNFGDEPCRYLLISEKVGPEICVYSDSGKVGFWEKENNRGTTGTRRSIGLRMRWTTGRGERPRTGPWRRSTLGS